MHSAEALLQDPAAAAKRQRAKQLQKADEYRGDSSGNIRFYETTHQYTHDDIHAHKPQVFSQNL
jgi:hypothetical protein